MLPVDEDDSIDFVRLEAAIDTLAGAGLDGIYTNGTAGEFYTQNEDEFIRISELVAERCESTGVPFQIGACHMSPQISLERIKRAVHFKPGAIQVILSDWNPLNEDEMIDCLKRMEECADGIGLVLYNPGHAKRVVKPESYAKLKAAVPGLIGVKVGGGDEQWYTQMKKFAEGISLFVPGHTLATGYSRGAYGSYSNVACLNPYGAKRWYELMKHELPKALELEQRIQHFIVQHIVPLITEQGYSNTAVDKLLAAVGGWADIGCRVRWPHRSIPQEQAERLQPIAHELIPELFSSNC